MAASTSPVCDKDSPDGQCPCLPNVDTPTCTIPLPGYYFRYLDHLLFEAEDAEISEVKTQKKEYIYSFQANLVIDTNFRELPVCILSQGVVWCILVEV